MIIPSIDLMDGKTVQLQQGRKKIIERNDTFSLAKEFDKYGEIALIDLNAAMNRGSNMEIMEKILKIAECRVGGGIKTWKQARKLISLGAKKIILGSKVFENGELNHDFLENFLSHIDRYRVIIALDNFNGEIVTGGWKKNTGLDILEVIPELECYASEFLVTCVEREGMMKGTNMEMIKKIAKKQKTVLQLQEVCTPLRR